MGRCKVQGLPGGGGIKWTKLGERSYTYAEMNGLKPGFVDLTGYNILFVRLRVQGALVGTDSRYEGNFGATIGDGSDGLVHFQVSAANGKTVTFDDELYGIYMRYKVVGKSVYWSCIANTSNSGSSETDPSTMEVSFNRGELTAGSCTQEVWGGKFEL